MLKTSTIDMELNKLVREREELRKLRETARQDGDLRENAEYQSATTALSRIDPQIENLETQRREIKFFEEMLYKPTKYVSLKSKVQLYRIDTDEDFPEYTIVPASLGNSKDGFLAEDTCLAKAILGKKEGDTCVVILPYKQYKVRIKEVN